MANIFAGGEELLNKKAFDKKVNVDIPLVHDSADNSVLKMTDFSNLGSNPATLQSFHDHANGDMTIGNYGSGIAFGSSNTLGILNVHWSNHQARVIGGLNSDNTGYWKEDIAWKSDIDALKARISALEKQIGGKTSRLYAYLRKALATSTVMEVA